MIIHFEHRGGQFRFDSSTALSIAITLDFEGPQPNHFGTDKAACAVLKLGGFVGDTQRGGSCNVDVLRMIPHCNGTHTETVGHIVDEDIWVGHTSADPFCLARLITVQPVAVERLPENDRGDVYRPRLDPNDQVITRAMLQAALGDNNRWEQMGYQALLIRTLPNPATKQQRQYGQEFQPPFFTVDAMELIVERQVQHLLVDFPSVDRMQDDGLLTNHHLFWNVPETTHRVIEDTHQDRTITEMVFVDAAIVDGDYVLNLQIPAFGSDAAPSRPVLFPCQQVTESKR